ncbi:MAG: hypothetical protein K5746_06565 [Clostridiales bacterium]|nr:hypothetical protein [Clostridiales bacterium]
MIFQNKAVRWLIPAVLLLLAAAVFVFFRPFLTRSTGKDADIAALPGNAASIRADAPFGVSDLTAEQLSNLRRDGTLRVSDGPRGISVGDPMDKILLSYPTDYTGEQPTDGQILYCAAFFRNRNGIMTALPPRGLLTDDDGRSLIVTLLAPVNSYPEGTADDYLRYEHVFCRYTIDPETMTVSSIVLGLEK